MKKIWLIPLFLILIFLGFIIYSLLDKKYVCFDNHCFQVELAISNEDKTRGLMYRDFLPEDKGMLFIYVKEGRYDFWMKNTLIPLDIIWINKENKVVYINKNSLPCTDIECESISSPTDALYVLEINGGLTDKYGIDENSYCIFQ